MPHASFDAVLEPNLVEVSNAVDQAAKEIGTRFDFKGTSAQVELKEKEITLFGDSDFQIGQVTRHPARQAEPSATSMRASSTASAKIEKIGGDKVKQASVKSGIDTDTAKKMQTRSSRASSRCRRDPGRHGARHRRQAGRAAGGDGADPQGGRRPPLSFNNFRD